MKKTLCSIDFTRIWERFLYQNTRNHNSYKFSHKLTFIPFLSLQRTQKQESNSQQVSGLVTRKFCFLLIASRALHQAMSNSIDFSRKIFLHVIPVRIIVPWCKLRNIYKNKMYNNIILLWWNQKQLPEVFHRKAVNKNFAIFKGKHLRWSLLSIKLQTFRADSKRDSNTDVFLVNIAKFLRISLLKNICEWLLPTKRPLLHYK